MSQLIKQRLVADDRWTLVREAAMRQRFGWDDAAVRYLGVYRDVVPAGTF